MENWTVTRAIALSVGLLAACATPAPPAAVPPSLTRVTTPEIGVVATKEVGEPLFATTVAATYEGIKFPEGARLAPAITPVGVFVKSASGAGDRYCGDVLINTQPLSGWCVQESWLQGKGIQYERGRFTRSDPENLRRELLYQGKVGDALKISYREYAGDLARPAFTQELTFDLGEGKVIGAKGARLEVIDASNIQITYRVLQPFSE